VTAQKVCSHRSIVKVLWGRDGKRLKLRYRRSQYGEQRTRTHSDSRGWNKKIEDCQKTLMIVDVRTPAEIREVREAVPQCGAYSSGPRLAQHLNDFPKAGEVAFYCGGGGRASPCRADALGRRTSEGFLLRYMRDWKRRSLPTAENGQKTLPAQK